MPATISKLPYGILGFLGLKNGGSYPRSLLETVQPTWDFVEFTTGVADEEIHQANVAINAANNFTAALAPVTVPNGETWYLRMAAARITTAVGEAWSGVFGVRRNATASASTNLLPLAPQFSVGASAFAYIVAERVPLVLASGDELGIYTSSITGAPVWRPAVRFARMPQ